jgi:hypothetical protein
MANLIKRIAISTSKRTGMHAMAEEFKSSSNDLSSRKTSAKRSSVHELASIVSFKAAGGHERIASLPPTGNQIKTTQEVTVTSEPNPFYDTNATVDGKTYLIRGRRPSEVEITGGYERERKMGVPSIVVEEPRKSLDGDSATEVADSLRSEGVEGMGKRGDSDDEVVLVGGKRWGRDG